LKHGRNKKEARKGLVGCLLVNSFSLNLQFRGILNKLKHFADQHSLKQKKKQKKNKQTKKAAYSDRLE